MGRNFYGRARPKAVVEDDNTLWIAKFSTLKDRWNQPVVENAVLKLAKISGLNVAESKTISVAGKDVLLVKRFDRDKNTNGYYRHRMVSALTLLKADDSLTSREQWSYLLLADEIRRVSEDPKADLRELFSRICFNALISNLDDHPRNHAILARNQGWRLAPAYDLTPAPIISKEERYLAMICGNDGRLARKCNLLSAHSRFFLSKAEALNIIDNMVTTIRHEWRACLHRAGASANEYREVENAFLYERFFINNANSG